MHLEWFLDGGDTGLLDDLAIARRGEASATGGATGAQGVTNVGRALHDRDGMLATALRGAPDRRENGEKDDSS